MNIHLYSAHVACNRCLQCFTSKEELAEHKQEPCQDAKEKEKKKGSLEKGVTEPSKEQENGSNEKSVSEPSKVCKDAKSEQKKSGSDHKGVSNPAKLCKVCGQRFPSKEKLQRHR